MSKNNIQNIHSIELFDAIKNKPVIFISGKAGTGKSTLIKQVHEKVKNSVLLAPTGMAALNIGGVTINSFFQLPFSPFTPDDPRLDNIFQTFKYQKEKLQLLQKIEVLLIDEISMVKPYTIDVIDKILQAIRNCTLPFGGIKVIMAGDLFQLPPVVSQHNGESEILFRFYPTPFFFSAQVFSRQELFHYELDKVYRQQDPQFIALLNRIRVGDIRQDDLNRLNTNIVSDSHILHGYLELVATNNEAAKINTSKLQNLSTNEHIFQATVKGDFPSSQFPTNDILRLKVGSQVMILRNNQNLRNGMIGTITAIYPDGVIVQRDQEFYKIEKYIWENIRYTYSPKTNKVEEETIGTFEQLPLRLAWAITIHKSQGQTFDKVMIEPKNIFAQGQTYVALSRCRSLNGLKLKSPIFPKHIKVSETVKAYYDYVFANSNQQKSSSSSKTTKNSTIQQKEKPINDSSDNWRDEFFKDLETTRDLKLTVNRFASHFPQNIQTNININFLFHIYSIIQNRVVGTKLNNILAIANLIMHSYSQYGDIFLKILQKHQKLELIINKDYKYSFQNKLQNFIENKPQQEHAHDILLEILFLNKKYLSNSEQTSEKREVHKTSSQFTEENSKQKQLKEEPKTVPTKTTETKSSTISEKKQKEAINFLFEEHTSSEKFIETKPLNHYNDSEENQCDFLDSLTFPSNTNKSIHKQPDGFSALIYFTFIFTFEILYVAVLTVGLFLGKIFLSEEETKHIQHKLLQRKLVKVLLLLSKILFYFFIAIILFSIIYINYIK